MTEQPAPSGPERVKRWGNRRKPAKRHGRVESPDSDPHTILDPRAPFRAAHPAKSLHVAGSHRAKTVEKPAPNGPQASCPGWQLLTGPDSTARSRGVWVCSQRSPLPSGHSVSSLATPHLHAGRQKPFWHTSMLRIIWLVCLTIELCTITRLAGCCSGLDAGGISGPNVPKSASSAVGPEADEGT